MANIGISFSPTNQTSPQQASRTPVSPVQDAIRILSFRQPTVLGVHAPVAQSLFSPLGLSSPSGAGLGNPDSGMIQDLLRYLFGGGAATGMPGPGAPTVSGGPTGLSSGPPSPTISLGGPTAPPPPSGSGSPIDTGTTPTGTGPASGPTGGNGPLSRSGDSGGYGSYRF